MNNKIILASKSGVRKKILDEKMVLIAKLCHLMLMKMKLKNLY